MTASSGQPRVWTVLCATLLLMGMVTRAAFSGGVEGRETRLISAYATLRELPDFVHASADGDALVLRHADGTVQLAELSGSLSVFRGDVTDAWACGDDVYFVLGGVGTDRWGYAMSTDDDLCMEGLRNVKLVRHGTPNVFEFQTER